MNARLAALLLMLASLLLGLGARADTYDTHTLVTLTVTSSDDLRFLQQCGVDIVGRRGDAYKALLTDEQLALVGERHMRVEVLYDEMAEDRRLWREADSVASPDATSYYTASKFNLVNPAAGTLMEHLLQLYNAHPDICRLFNLGATQDGAYDIIAMKVSRNPDAVEPEPKIRIYGNIHGDEKGGLMVACDVLDAILAGYTAVPQDAKAKKLVEGAEMWFIPMGNPYGNAHSTRYNSRSVDLNRNFWGPSGSDASPAWSERETQVIRDLTETATADHRKLRFTTSLSFHGGDTCFNSLWNYTTSAPSDEPIFWASRTGGTGCGSQTIPNCPTLAPDGLAEAYKDGCTTNGFWFTEGYDWYGTRGDTNDWSYGAWTDLDTTIEATGIKTPPAAQIPSFTAEHRQAVLNYMLKTFQGIHGVMSDAATGAPLDGTVAVTATASATIPVPHDYQAVYSDPVAGDFHRVLQPGTYTVTCRAPGYFDTVVTGVIVTVDMGTQVDCSMSNSTCANNPTAVDVTPNGPLTSCAGTGRLLTATPTGGTGLGYQWYDGASPIAGATSSTYTANATGTHTFNCRVTGSGCASGLSDGTPTSITWQSAPTFAGLSSVTNPGLGTCGLDLSWNAGTTPCPGGVTYAIYRATSSGFTPGPTSRIASGLSGTTYRDQENLANGTAYYYVVRAANVSDGTEETNLTEKAGVPYGPVSTQTLTDTFEGAQSGGGFDLTGWTHSAVSGSTNWVWSTAQKYDGTHSWFAQDIATASDMTLVSPPFGVVSSTTLTFYHTYKFEGTSTCYDGGTLEVSTDGGSTWAVVPDADFTSGSFNGTVSTCCSNPIGGKRAWCFGTVGAMTPVVVNLGSDANLVNRSVQIRWHEGNDSSTFSTGWYVDHVVITNAGTSGACTTGSAIPGEAAPGDTSASAQSWPDKSTQSWPAVAGATFYTLYRGLLADLPNLLNGSVDSCTKASGGSTSVSVGDDPSGVTGKLYWYLVTASNLAGQGTAGSATGGVRAVNSSGTCAP